MTNTELKDAIDLAITTETAPNSVSTADVGNNMKLIVDYVDQQVGVKVYKAKLSQSGTGNITGVVLKNDTGKTFTFSRSGVGSYSINFSSIYLDLDKVDIRINLQQSSYAIPSINIDNLNTMATIQTKYWNGSNFVVSDDILQNATLYLIVNN